MKAPAAADKLALAWGALGAIAIWLGFPNNVGSIPVAVLIWPLALINLGALCPSLPHAFRRGWLASWAGFCAALYWLALPVAQVGGLPWPGAAGCAALIACALATQGGFFAALAWGVQKKPFWQALVLLALGWYLLELGFACALGFPWLPLAGALAPWPVFTQTADLCGAYFTGALWLAALLPCFSRGKRVIGFALTAILIGYGAWRLADDPVEPWPQGHDSIAALMVEGNIDQNQKWTAPFQQQSLDTYKNLTGAGLAATKDLFEEQKPLILWPETALPFFYERDPRLAAKVNAAAAAFGCPLLFGAPGTEKSGNGDDIYNRAFLLGPDGRQAGHYDKVHLVPFGEYLPKWLKLDFLEALLQGVGVYSEGTSARPLIYGDLALGVLICYEGIFPWLAQERVAAGANLLVDISNDGWFGESPAARQHLYLTALRGLEQGRWLLRATNTGISAVVDARGRVVLRGPMFRAGYLPCRARIGGGLTIYHYLAGWLPWLALGMFSGLLATRERGG